MTGGTAPRVDLHTHTTVSDGALTPPELVARAVARGVDILAITDHDTTDGVAAATDAAEGTGLEIVPGIELNCDLPDGHADILGYCVDMGDPDFQALLARIRQTREDRARRMVAQLQALGAPIDYGQVAALSGKGSVGRPHVARALVESGFVSGVGAAFKKYIGRDGPAYADRYRLSPADACAAVRDAGGVPGLAHPLPPGKPMSDPKGLRTFLPDLVDAGLGALECYYPGYTLRAVRWLEALAHHFGLIPTGGSDFHGPWRPERELGCVNVPAASVARLRAEALT